MARIADEIIERIKRTVSLARLAEGRGVLLEKRGADLVGRCPFHEDKTPSLVITPAKNLWHCLGACQQGGTVIDWVMKAEGVSFRHAVELLQNDALPLVAASSSNLPSAGPPVKSTVKKLPTALPKDAADGRLLSQVIEYYHQTLLQSPEGLEYLNKRGIGSPEAVRYFKLGFANRTLGYRLPEKNRAEGAALRGQLQRIGLMRASGHEHFNGSIVVPVMSLSGEITEVYGRKITEGLRPGTPLHLYLPGPHRGVWNATALSGTKEVILCEALIDALTFWCAGYRNVTAAYGVEGFTADHLAAFKAHGIERVLIAYDRDEAGDKAAEKLKAKLTAEGLDCYRVLFPKGMDANEYALKVGPAAKSLGVAIRSAQWLGKGKPKSIETAAVEAVLMSESLPELSPLPSVDGASEPESLSAMDKETAIDAADLPARASFISSSLAAEEAAKEKTETNDLGALSSAQSLSTQLPSAGLPCAAVPDAPTPPAKAEAKTLGAEREYLLTFGERRYRVRGLERNASFEALKVNVLAARSGIGAGLADGITDAVHVDTFDLYHARQRAAFIHQTSVELGLSESVIKADIGKLLLALESEQEKLLTAAREPQVAAVKMEESEREAALALLRDEKLIERIASDFSRCGMVGEGTNVLVGYLAAISRKLDRPLALLIQSTSAAGKSSLLDAVLRFVPEEDRTVYSAMTGQSLFYMGELNLKHKLLAIAEEEGASRASYALKLLQSEGELTIASTTKDAATGKLATEQYRVEGPVMLALTTTAAEIDEELLNRCLVLSIDEGREQTQAIHAAQRERRTLAGLHARAEREALFKLHQNAQRLIESLAVVNPHAHKLTFLDDRTRTRRDHEKYLTLIDVIALLHQHQREIKTVRHGGKELRYVEVTLQDIALANRLAHEVLGRTLDELPPQTRTLLKLIVAMVEAECGKQSVQRSDYRFSRRQVREATRWGDTQLKIHLARLVQLEYLLVHRGGRGQSFEYELLFDGANDSRHLSGLIDIGGLEHGYDGARSGQKEERPGSGRPPAGARSVGGRGDESGEKQGTNNELSPRRPTNQKNAHQGMHRESQSYIAERAAP